MKMQKRTPNSNVTSAELLKELHNIEARLKERLEHSAHSITNDVEMKVMRREHSNNDADIRMFKLQMNLDKVVSMLEKLELKFDRLTHEPLNLIEKSFKHQ